MIQVLVHMSCKFMKALLLIKRLHYFCGGPNFDKKCFNEEDLPKNLVQNFREAKKGKYCCECIRKIN